MAPRGAAPATRRLAASSPGLIHVSMNPHAFAPPSISRPPSRRATGLGLFVALGVPFIGFALTPAMDGRPSIERLAWGAALHWLHLAALLAIVAFLERRDASSIGVRRWTWGTIPLGIAAAALMFVATPLVQGLNTRLGLHGDSTLVVFLMGLPFALRLLLTLTAGVFEETLFRGYALERLAEITGSRPAAALVTWAAFTLAHGPAYGFTHLLPIAGIGALVTALYLWRRNLVVNIVAHAVFDGVPLLLLPALVHPH